MVDPHETKTGTKPNVSSVDTKKLTSGYFLLRRWKVLIMFQNACDVDLQIIVWSETNPKRFYKNEFKDNFQEEYCDVDDKNTTICQFNID